MAKQTPEELVQEAQFIFRGTVVRQGATWEGVPVTAQTAVVRVDEVIQAPNAFADYAGREITVQLAGRGTPRGGQQSVFYTNGWLYGEGIAVRSVGQTPVNRVPVSLAATNEPARNLEARDLRQRVSNADIIVTGKVASVNDPSVSSNGQPLGFAANNDGGEAWKPVSEHDPHWREAVVQIDAVEKGATGTSGLVVRFPSSTDVRWFRAPKFEAGQQGVFLLQKTDVPASSQALAAAPDGTEEASYTASDPADALPIEQLANIRSLIQNG